MRNKREPTPIVTDHRLTRFLTVVWLRLLRMAGQLLIGAAPRRDELNAFSRFVAAFLLIRAAKLVDSAPAVAKPRPLNAPRGFSKSRGPTPFAFVRAAVGARLHRELRAPDPLAHIAALICAILDIDALARRLARRLKRRLTRLRPLVLVCAPPAAITGLLFAPQPQAQDSS